ncbi:MAG: hypothetical protein EDM05_011865 [Leptolyngbya sp. IPPAS B-1204]
MVKCLSQLVGWRTLVRAVSTLAFGLFLTLQFWVFTPTLLEPPGLQYAKRGSWGANLGD